VNGAVPDAPELVNQDAYANWLFKMKPANAADLGALLDAAGYQTVVDAEK
jgi:glycine cleavage system H protein